MYLVRVLPSTNQTCEESLGSFDRLAVHAVVDDASDESLELTVTREPSGQGRAWVLETPPAAGSQDGPSDE